jgi:hypothetical protein
MAITIYDIYAHAHRHKNTCTPTHALMHAHAHIDTALIQLTLAACFPTCRNTLSYRIITECDTESEKNETRFF